MTTSLEEIEICVPVLRRYARALTHDPDLADDLVQDRVERAIRKRALFRPDGPVRPWLFRILLNLYRNELRRRRRRGEHVEIDPEGADSAVPGNQQSRLELAETARALQRLPAEQRETLLLIALKGMSYAEAAEILDIPVGTVMSRLSRARQGLRAFTGAPERRLRRVK